ncbi:MAG TPA: SCO family protein [Phnomibacter sp.]|nr:SCO family protein [Phnomibacter sp.]
MSTKRKLLIYGLGSILLLAGFFYFVFRGTDDWKVKLPVISYVKPFHFVNQAGDTITQDKMAGKVYVANYFFATCNGICPNMNGKLKTVFEQYKSEEEFAIISHTCQPENDSVPALKKYCDSIGADGKQWQFVTGNKLELYSTARESYMIDDPKNNVGKIDDQFMHSQFLALVDRQGRVRGIYDGLKQKEVNLLKEDIEGLLKEKDRSSFVNNIFGNAPSQ